MQLNSTGKTLGSQGGLINKEGHCLLFFNGGHELMGGTLGAIETDVFTKNLIRNRSFGERFLLNFSMISSDGLNHGLSCGNQLEPSESMRCN